MFQFKTKSVNVDNEARWESSRDFYVKHKEQIYPR